jgi:1-aminocyclopropane-1-carboxylate deaminase
VLWQLTVASIPRCTSIISSRSLITENCLQKLRPTAVCGGVLDLCSVLHLDRLNPPAGGNKAFKLKHNLAELNPGDTVLSFGGAWSNHIHALAAMGRQRGLQTIGVIRGERPAQLSATLRDAVEWGMQLHFVSRSDYRRRHDPAYIDSLQSRFGPCRIIPEGGANTAGVRGCREIVSMLHTSEIGFDLIAVACGTGSTLAGLVCDLDPGQRGLGVAVLKGLEKQPVDVGNWVREQGVPQRDNWSIESRFHCGGYARNTPELRKFVREFERVQGLPLDPVYTAKLFFALYQLRVTGELADGVRVLALHTGGLQGRRGVDWL